MMLLSDCSSEKEETPLKTFDFDSLLIHIRQTELYVKAKQIIAYHKDFEGYGKATRL